MGSCLSPDFLLGKQVVSCFARGKWIRIPLLRPMPGFPTVYAVVPKV